MIDIDKHNNTAIHPFPRGRQLAEQMQSQHPELVEQIRQQMNRGGPGGGSQGGGDGGNQNPPPS